MTMTKSPWRQLVHWIHIHATALRIRKLHGCKPGQNLFQLLEHLHSPGVSHGRGRKMCPNSCAYLSKQRFPMEQLPKHRPTSISWKDLQNKDRKITCDILLIHTQRGTAFQQVLLLSSAASCCCVYIRAHFNLFSDHE